jgi:hypothetical protein
MQTSVSSCLRVEVAKTLRPLRFALEISEWLVLVAQIDQRHSLNFQRGDAGTQRPFSFEKQSSAPLRLCVGDQ